LFAGLRRLNVPVVELKDVAKSVFTGITPKSGGDAYTMDRQTGIPFVRSGEITEDGLVVEETEICLKPEVHNGIMRRSRLRKGDVLIAIVGATIGQTGIYNRDAEANINQAIAGVRLDNRQLLPEYLVAFLKTPTGQAILDFLKRPVARANINLDEIGSIVVPLPSPDRQTALLRPLEIARGEMLRQLAQANALLNGIDDLVLAELALPKPAADGRLAYAVRLNGIRARLNPDYYHPERVLSVRVIEQAKGTLRAARLEEIADFMRDIVKVSEDEPYLGLASIEPNTGELTGQDETAKGLAFTFRKDDVLFSRLRPYLNKVRRAEEPGTCSTEFHVIRIKKGLPCPVLPEYLACVLRSSPILAQTRRMMTGNTHPRLANEDVVNLVVPIPDEKAQRRIVDDVAKRKEEVRRARAEAVAGWAAALAAFEAKLIGNAGKA